MESLQREITALGRSRTTILLVVFLKIMNCTA